MSTRTPKLAAAAGSVVVALALTACGGNSKSNGNDAQAGGGCKPAHNNVKTIEQGTLTVAAYVYPPFADVKDGKLTGAEGEILTKVAEMECLKIKVVQGASSAMIPNVQSKRADTTLGSWYRTAKRAEVVRLGAPVVADRLSLVSASGVSSIQDLKGKKVGSVLGFLWNDDMKKLLGDDYKLYDSAEAEYADLKAGRIEVAVNGSSAAAYQLQKHPIDGAKIKIPGPDPAVKSTLKPGQTQFPVSKDNEDLGKAMDENVATLRKSGELKKILDKYGYVPEASEPGEPNLL
ncbi:amino acid ABC transporter substrate-binding protein [Planosporangium flavigriseum]|uniref:Cystine ABC transporter substrate-binding protein n=1 Tax=Planosporangium flavigriseum TaxID=373681 RepID=A0A8J3LMV6_9ACTN|nr:transporter substrate-binding domain-containing protein [Planosporangium flavigriseum]NJC65756.1 amino acid ABC transporter substrate-binding protein [Planosporangium flavigriseum]GIG73610.1 cystine ABC transporter substrate-binding protein [Planosporangium flavigriseum]